MSLGVTFRPSDQQAQQGPMQAGKEGTQGTIQMLSLRYPKVSGAASPVGDPSLLAGNTPRVSGFNPNAAIFRALIQALSGGSPDTGSAAMGGAPAGMPAGAPMSASAATAPSFQFGVPGSSQPAGPESQMARYGSPLDRLLQLIPQGSGWNADPYHSSFAQGPNSSETPFRQINVAGLPG